MTTELPTWEGFLIYALRALADGQVRNRREIRSAAAREAKLTDAERALTLASGQLTFENRVGWALSYLTNVGALARPRRGHYEITPAGRNLMAVFPQGMRERDVEKLTADPASGLTPYQSTARRSSSTGEPTTLSESSVTPALPSMTPTEQVQDGIERIHEDVANDLLDRLRGREPAFFEQAVVALLLAMGYGGTLGSGAVTQLSNDGGIDGVIDQDYLGLSRVYIQAKR